MYVVYCQNKPKSEFIVSAYIDTYFEVIILYIRILWQHYFYILFFIFPHTNRYYDEKNFLYNPRFLQIISKFFLFTMQTRYQQMGSKRDQIQIFLTHQKFTMVCTLFLFSTGNQIKIRVQVAIDRSVDQTYTKTHQIPHASGGHFEAQSEGGVAGRGRGDRAGLPRDDGGAKPGK